MSDINNLVDIARGEIGTEEGPQHQNEGSSIKKYQDATSLGENRLVDPIDRLRGVHDF